MRPLLALACVAAAACGGDDAPAPVDAAVTVDASPDASPAACPTATSCPCFTNYDCPTGYACVSQDSSGTMVYCQIGPRGSGALGATCTGEADCASALCVDGANGGMRCSDICANSNACPADLPVCRFIAGPDVSICTP